MSWLDFLRRGKGAARFEFAPGPGEGETLPVQDTRAAIDELSQVVRNNPEAVEIYLALGSLYRSQGEIERAIQIRNNLIVRPGLDPKFRARAWFELGRDFRRGGFLDRAAHAFDQARSLMGDRPAILQEQALLAADGGEFERAAELYGRLGRPLPQAHYLVRRAQELAAGGDAPQAGSFLRKAVKVYPGSVEAWAEHLTSAYREGSASRLKDALGEALVKADPAMRFVFLEGLADAAAGARREGGEAAPLPNADLLQTVIPVLSAQEPDVLLYYYGARLLLQCGQRLEARSWLEKTLVLRPDFWLARLEVFRLTKDEQSFTPFFKEQLEFFMDKARRLRRFVCRGCGLKRDAVFYLCPRCRSWHSIAFRYDFTQ
ncbi:hypothetical protein M7784_03750 [Desulfovibrio aminophilus]|nr:tetratricopeptide repeat protein [Desulfovibrio aminophilus]MCM0754359.1 hypothetical protein [Desulfovibrio aminophilus]